ncbi:MAG: sigma-70 family RNA polymerase sigma factor [Pseudomonadota bacterium]
MRDDATSTDRRDRDERWRDLMRSAQGGNSFAYARLLEEVTPVIRGLVRRRWHSPNDVEDIVQDILLSVHLVRHTYDSARPFGPWLGTIAKRRIADFARKMASRRANETTVAAMPETFPLDEPKTEQDISDDQGEVRRALAALSPPQRQAIELMKLQGLSLEEASMRTGKSVSALKVTVHRAMKAMRRILE